MEFLTLLDGCPHPVYMTHFHGRTGNYSQKNKRYHSSKLKAINLKKHRKNRAFTGTLKKHGVKISMDGKWLAWIIFS